MYSYHMYECVAHSKQPRSDWCCCCCCIIPCSFTHGTQMFLRQISARIKKTYLKFKNHNTEGKRRSSLNVGLAQSGRAATTRLGTVSTPTLSDQTEEAAQRLSPTVPGRLSQTSVIAGTRNSIRWYETMETCT